MNVVNACPPGHEATLSMVVFLPQVRLKSQNKEGERMGGPFGSNLRRWKRLERGHTTYKSEFFQLQAAWDGVRVGGDEGLTLERQRVASSLRCPGEGLDI